VYKASDKVYVIGNIGVGTVKIGIAVDVSRRLVELASGWLPHAVDPRALDALRVYETPLARSLETVLHAAFAPARLRRAGMIRSSSVPTEGLTEWFRLGVGALSLIDGVAQRKLREWRI